MVLFETPVKKKISWSSRLGSVVTNPASTHGAVSSIPALTQWVKDPKLLQAAAELLWL